MADKRRLKTAIAALLVISWLVITLVGTGIGLLLLEMGALNCEADPAVSPFGDSNYGVMEWSFVPPGPRCVWTVETNGFAASDRPAPIWSLWLLTVVALGYLAWRQLAAAAATWDPPPAPSPGRPPDPSGATKPPGPARPPYET